MKSYTLARCHMGRLQPGEDLLAGLLRKTKQLYVRSGYIKVLGAVRQAKVGFYDQEKNIYHSIKLDDPLEIVTCHGNISEKEGQTALHLHISVANDQGKSFGGHLQEGTEVAVAEFCIFEFEGEQPLQREYDPDFNLDLWPSCE